MMNSDHINKLTELVSLLEKNLDFHEYIPLMVEKINLLIMGVKNHSYDSKQISQFVWEIERYISEDMVFCKTEIGENIFTVLNTFIDEQKR